MTAASTSRSTPRSASRAGEVPRWMTCGSKACGKGSASTSRQPRSTPPAFITAQRRWGSNSRWKRSPAQSESTLSPGTSARCCTTLSAKAGQSSVSCAMGAAADTGGRPAVFPVDETINNANAKTTLAGGQSTGRTDERNAVNPPFRIIAISLAKRGAYQQPYRADRSACSACEPRLEHVDEPLLIVMKQPSRFILLDETRLGDFEVACPPGFPLRRVAEEAMDTLPRFRVLDASEQLERAGIEAGLLARFTSRRRLGILARLDQSFRNAPSVPRGESAGFDDEHLEATRSPAIEQRSGGLLHQGFPRGSMRSSDTRRNGTGSAPPLSVRTRSFAS